MLRMTKSLKPVLSLKQFLIRQEVLKAFKQIIKSANRIDDASYRKYMIDWARHDFKANKNLSDEVGIKIELTRAKMTLKELEHSIQMAK